MNQMQLFNNTSVIKLTLHIWIMSEIPWIHRYIHIITSFLDWRARGPGCALGHCWPSGPSYPGTGYERMGWILAPVRKLTWAWIVWTLFISSSNISYVKRNSLNMNYYSKQYRGVLSATYGLGCLLSMPCQSCIYYIYFYFKNVYSSVLLFSVSKEFSFRWQNPYINVGSVKGQCHSPTTLDIRTEQYR